MYLKSLNYLVFIFSNRLFQFAGYVVWAVIFVRAGSMANALAVGAWFIFFALGLDALVLGLLNLILVRNKIFSLPESDQALRTVGIYYGVKLGMDPLTWKMYNSEEGNSG